MRWVTAWGSLVIRTANASAGLTLCLGLGDRLGFLASRTANSSAKLTLCLGLGKPWFSLPRSALFEKPSVFRITGIRPIKMRSDETVSKLPFHHLVFWHCSLHTCTLYHIPLICKYETSVQIAEGVDLGTVDQDLKVQVGACAYAGVSA